MSRADEIRASLVDNLEHSAKTIAEWQSTMQLDAARLAAHDEAVEAMRAEQPHVPLTPETLGPGTQRAKRRNIVTEVWERLTDTGKTTEDLAGEIGGVKNSQVQAALLKLGDKIECNPIWQGDVQRPGYLRATSS